MARNHPAFSPTCAAVLLGALSPFLSGRSRTLLELRWQDQHLDQEPDRFADQAHSSRDSLQHLSAEQTVDRFDFRA